MKERARADKADSGSPTASRTIVVGVTGGIAAYKTCTIVSRLAQQGHQVTVLMTASATKFVAPLTFEALSGRPVHTSLWEQVEAHDSQHIALARSAALMLIAPCSANTLAKLAHGMADNVVTTVAMALKRGDNPTPLTLAPSMNADMWTHPIVQRNLAVVRDELGARIIGPESGWQACRTEGQGRMSEPEQILEQIAKLLK